MKYIDLTHTITSNIAVSPFDKNVRMKQVKQLDIDSYNDTEITTTMHIGTHIDAPSHVMDSEVYISDYPVEKFIGKGVLLDFENQKNISLRKLDQKKIKQDSIVVIYTNMDKKIGTDEYYYDHPKLTKEFCDYLVSKQIKILALDFFSPESMPLDIHKKLLSNDILIVENLKDVHLLKDKDFIMHVIPIKIKTEGAFIRAYAELITT